MSDFYIADIEMYLPESGSGLAAEAWGVVPQGALSQLPSTVGASETLCIGDSGYRSRATDAGGIVVYPPHMLSAFALDRRLPLDPAASPVGAAWGSIDVANAGQRFDPLASSRNTDGRPVLIRRGVRSYDAARRLYVDPPIAELTTAFAGLALPWELSESTLSIPLRGASYWIERPVQQSVYSGGAGLGGGAALAGKPMPMVRGMVSRISPVAVDPVNRIYQYTDGAGTITAVYEGGAAVFGYGGNVADLYTGSTTPGQYRTDNARGLFQLGSTPARPITIDATGSFPTAGLIHDPVGLAWFFLGEQCLVPAASLDETSFANARLATWFTNSGIYLGPEVVEGTEVIAHLMSSVGGGVIPGRDGKLRAVLLRAPATLGAATWTEAEIITLDPLPLAAPLAPPPYRWRVGYGRNYSPTGSDLAGTLTDAQRAAVAREWQYSTWIDTGILTAYRRPSDPPPLGTCLGGAADAQVIADALGALWGVRRRYLAVSVPLEIGIVRELGDEIAIRYPLEDLASGRVGIIVAEQMRAGEASIMFGVII